MTPERVRADFDRREVVPPATAGDWVPSPQGGVERRLLDRVGGEVARATSIVRYAPGSSFHRHVHGGGEEFLVLEGTFSDERGDCPAGTYVRNPPGSSHAPFSRDGCTILVKLWQFAPGDHEAVRLDTSRGEWRPAGSPGVERMPLHAHDGIETSLVRWAPNARLVAHGHPGGEELYVLAGTLHDEHGDYPAGTWVRNPRGSTHAPWAGGGGATVWAKTGHLGAAMLSPG